MAFCLSAISNGVLIEGACVCWKKSFSSLNPSSSIPPRRSLCRSKKRDVKCFLFSKNASADLYLPSNCENSFSERMLLFRLYKKKDANLRTIESEISLLSEKSVTLHSETEVAAPEALRDDISDFGTCPFLLVAIALTLDSLREEKMYGISMLSGKGNARLLSKRSNYLIMSSTAGPTRCALEQSLR